MNIIMGNFIEQEQVQIEGQVVAKWPEKTEARTCLPGADIFSFQYEVVGHSYQINRLDRNGLRGVIAFFTEMDGSQGRLESGDEVLLVGSRKRMGPFVVPLTTRYERMEKA